MKRSYKTLKVWTKVRGRNALKVSLAYTIAMFVSVYFLNFESTVVDTVALLCSYGTQYSGGSLRQSIQLGTGIPAGAVIGATLQQMVVLCASIFPMPWMTIVLTECAVFVWMYYAMILNFRGGPYAYVAFNAAFTSVPFLLDPTTDFQITVQHNLYGCLLTVGVELLVLSVDAEDLLRSRISAALAGAVASLSALLTSSARSLAKEELTPYQAPVLLADVEISDDHRGRVCPRSPTKRDSTVAKELPDLTDRLIAIGLYTTYIKWRNDYIAWRKGGAHGARGEKPDRKDSTLRRSQSAPGDLCSVEFRCEGPQFIEWRRNTTWTDLEGINDASRPSNALVVLHEDAAFIRGIAVGGNCTLDEADVESVVAPEDSLTAEAVANVFEAMEADIVQHAVSELPTISSLFARGSPLVNPIASPALPFELENAVASNEQTENRPGTLGRVSYTRVLRLLQEVSDALEPVQDLVIQAAERLDGRSVDTQTWITLADYMNMVHLRVLVLCRIARRLGHGVDIAELLKYEGEGGATSDEVLEAFGVTLTSAMLTVLGSGVLSADSADQLETRLRHCAKSLVYSLGERSQQIARSHGQLENVAAEVLAGTSTSMLTALLQDASYILSMAVTLSADWA